MNRSLSRRLLLTLAATGLCGCGGNDRTPAPDHRATGRQFAGTHPIRVVCTTGQVAEMRDVGGEHVAVDALMGPGVDPHLYTPVSSDATKLSRADVILYNGLHLEGRMTELFAQMSRRKATFAVTSGLEDRANPGLRRPPKFEGVYDPHVWHDAALWADCVGDVADMLAHFDPPHADDYRRNAAAYRDALLQVDAYCREQIGPIPPERRVLVTAHDAFAYFGAAYGIEVYGLKGISTEAEKDLGHQAEIQRMLIERRVPAVFVESAVAPRTVQSLVEPCRAAGWNLKIGGQLYADAMGAAGTPAADYAGMLRANVDTIVEALADP